MGATHSAFDLSESVGYIDLVYEDYLKHGGVPPKELEGARVLELGPGDSLGVALRFIADGAESVVAVDRFVTRRDEAQQRGIYRALAERSEPAARARIEAALEDGEARTGALRLIEGLPVEEAAEELEPGSFDLIVSRAVLEHVLDLDAAFDAMTRLLKPGGRLVHEIDLRDHDLFLDQHPLTFLTIPDPVYRWMGAASGLPNRRLVDYYRGATAARGFEAAILVTHVIGEDEADAGPRTRVRDTAEVEGAAALVEQIRPRLLPRYRDLAAADLAISGIFLVASRG